MAQDSLFKWFVHTVGATLANVRQCPCQEEKKNKTETPKPPVTPPPDQPQPQQINLPPESLVSKLLVAKVLQTLVGPGVPVPVNSTHWRVTLAKDTRAAYWWHAVTREVQWHTPEEIYEVAEKAKVVWELFCLNRKMKAPTPPPKQLPKPARIKPRVACKVQRAQPKRRFYTYSFKDGGAPTRRHVSVHKKNEKGRYSCFHCNADFARSDHRKRHMDTRCEARKKAC